VKRRGRCVRSALVTWISIIGGECWYGVGFLIAAGISTCVAVVLVNKRVRDLEYDTFTTQWIYN
tara:strand:- start:16 stop:207 length:192 start_codon:yes stop_codon:yes gene_type:complete